MDIEFMWRLRKALDDKGITRTELSELSGIRKGDITHYLKGSYVPKQDKCYMLAKALDVDPGWLMTGYEQNSEPFDNKAFGKYIDDLDRKEAFDLVDIYMELSEEHRKDAMNYVRFLKSQEGKQP